MNQSKWGTTTPVRPLDRPDPTPRRQSSSRRSLERRRLVLTSHFEQLNFISPLSDALLVSSPLDLFAPRSGTPSDDGRSFRRPSQRRDAKWSTPQISTPVETAETRRPLSESSSQRIEREEGGSFARGESEIEREGGISFFRRAKREQQREIEQVEGTRFECERSITG